MLNKLLQQQINAYLSSTFEPDETTLLLLNAISDTYDHCEKERSTMKHSIEISSMELREANEKLREEANENAIALRKLKESLDLMKNEDSAISSLPEKELKIIDLANIISKETGQRKQAEEKQIEYLHNLEKKNRELDQFAYIVSHDLKAPLRAIASLADWIKEDAEELLSAESKQNLDLLRGRVTRMEQLIFGILAYSKVGKIPSEKSVIPVHELLHNIIDSLNPPKHFSISIPSDLPTIETEMVKLQQVFGNLISNSIKYMDKSSGQIQIGWLQLEDCCQFYVEDNGPGIEKEYHEKIFVIFQTLSARDEIESTGIGLSIVKKIIEEQGGKIWVESESEKDAGSPLPGPLILKNLKQQLHEHY